MQPYRGIRWTKLGIHMRKVTIVLAALMAVGMTGAADAAKKKSVKAPEMSAQERSNMLIRDAFQPWNTKWAAPAKATRSKKGKKRG